MTLFLNGKHTHTHTHILAFDVVDVFVFSDLLLVAFSRSFYTIVDTSYGEPVRQGAHKPRRRVTFDTYVVDNCALVAHTSTN